VHACQSAALDPTHRARSTILLLRETLVLSTIILYDGRLQLVAWTNKTLRHHRKEWLEMEIVENKSAKQTNKLCSIVPLQLHSCNHERFTFFLFSTCSLFLLSLLCYSRDVVGSPPPHTGVYFIDPTTLFLVLPSRRAQFFALSPLVSLPSVSSFCSI
jgi:hypothetical protein